MSIIHVFTSFRYKTFDDKKNNLANIEVEWVGTLADESILSSTFDAKKKYVSHVRSQIYIELESFMQYRIVLH